jgi:hypothetical protein
LAARVATTALEQDVHTAIPPLDALILPELRTTILAGDAELNTGGLGGPLEIESLANILVSGSPATLYLWTAPARHSERRVWYHRRQTDRRLVALLPCHEPKKPCYFNNRPVLVPTAANAI